MKKILTAFLAAAPVLADRGGWQHQHEDAPPLSALRYRRRARQQATHPTLHFGNDHDNSGMLDKTVFSPKIRMVFLVGLEGSGHHLMTSVLERVCTSARVICPHVCPIADAAYNSMGCASTTSEYEQGIDSLRNEMDALALTLDSLQDGGDVVLANFHDCPGRKYRVGMMSFPNYHGPDKPLQYVDLKILAEEAERINVDLRMIYLDRAARDILVSTTIHREFGRWVDIYVCLQPRSIPGVVYTVQDGLKSLAACSEPRLDKRRFSHRQAN